MKYRTIEKPYSNFYPQYKRFLTWKYFTGNDNKISFKSLRESNNFIFAKRQDKFTSEIVVHKYNKMWGVKK